MNSSLHTRYYHFGLNGIISLHSNLPELFGMIDLRDGPPGEREKFAEIFFLESGKSPYPDIHIPPETEILSGNEIISISSLGQSIYYELYNRGKAVLDTGRLNAVITLKNMKVLNPEFVSRMILRPVMDRLMWAAGWLPLHSSGVIWDGRCIVFAGSTGVGKSTLVKGLESKGAVFMSDDRTFISCDGGDVRFSSLPEYMRSGKIRKKRKNPVKTAQFSKSGTILILSNEGSGRISIADIGPAEAIARLVHSIPLLSEKGIHPETADFLEKICRSCECRIVKGISDQKSLLDSVYEHILHD